jgi:hypothetical protein
MTTDLMPPPPPPPAPAPAGNPYPVRMTIARPEKQSRLTNFPLFIGSTIRFILVIPHAIIVYFMGMVASLLYFLATFAILFTRRYPKGMHDFVVGYLRWSVCVTGYTSHLYDKYPPFTTDPQGEYPLSFECDYPERSSRLTNFPLLGYVIRVLVLFPQFLVYIGLAISAFVVGFIALFAILFTGSYPAGMHGFVVGVTRWNLRLQAYMLGITDRYPPFSMA